MTAGSKLRVTDSHREAMERLKVKGDSSAERKTRIADDPLRGILNFPTLYSVQTDQKDKTYKSVLFNTNCNPLLE
jgi:hypothetical protein